MRRVTKIVFLLINIFVAVIYLLACLAPYLDPKKWWFISLIGLGFAFLFVTLVAFILFWLVFKPRYTLISLIPILIGYKIFMVFFCFSYPRKIRLQQTQRSNAYCALECGAFCRMEKK